MPKTAAPRGRAPDRSGSSFGRFLLRQRLGRGADGDVYRALDPELGREVAIKLLRPDGPPEECLRREARLLASLAHPAIASVLDWVQVGHQAGLILELVEGESLASRLESGPASFDETLQIGIAIAEALAHAHERGIVHRDLKPANVVATRGGGLKILDFGLAALSGEDDGRPRPAGTIGYLAPEVLRGEPQSAASDVFALGVILYELLTAEPLFRGETTEGVGRPVLAHLRPETPPPLDATIRRALDPEPGRRPPAEMLARELRALRERIDRAAPGRAAGGGAEPVAFRGLFSFQETDAETFFGRDAEVAALLDLVTSGSYRFGVLYGESGSGKTSLVQAALVPRLRREGWLPVTCRTHGDPLGDLVRRVRRATGVARDPGVAPADWLVEVAAEIGAPILVILDQFEELFAAHPDPADREPLLEMVTRCHASAGGRVRFLLVVRHDFLHRIGEAFDGRVPEPLAAEGRFLLHALKPEQAAAVLDRSARLGRLEAAPGLWRNVATDLTRDGRVLPSELQIVGEQIQRRQILSLAAYRRLGGVPALLHAHLEEVLVASGREGEARALLSTLVAPEGTRRAATEAEIRRHCDLSAAEVRRLLDLLLGARLVRETGEGDPPRFELVHEYLVERIRDLAGEAPTPAARARLLLRHYLREHAVDPSARIPLRRAWMIRRRAGALEGTERDLVSRSLRRGVVRWAAVGGLLTVLISAVAALSSVREAWDERILAEGHRAAARQLALAPDGRSLVSAGEDGRVLLWDLAAGVLVRELATLSGPAQTVAFSPDGRWLAAAGRHSEVLVWRVEEGARLQRLAVPVSDIRWVGFSPDSRLLLAGFHRATRVWRVGSWETERDLTNGTSYGNHLFLGPRRVLPYNSNRTIDLGDSAGSSLSLHPRERGHEGGNWSAVSPAGTRIVRVDGDGWLEVWDAATGDSISSRRVHHDHARTVSFSPDGRWLASGADDLLLWSAEDLTLAQRFRYPAIVWSALFTADGERLVSSHGDGAILVWNIAERRLEANLSGHAAPVRTVAFSPDGRSLATGGDDRSIIVWQAGSGRKVAILRGHDTRVNGIAFAPDGRWLGSCDQDGTLFTWSLPDGSAEWRGSEGLPCYGVAASGSPDRLFSGRRLWERRDRQLVPLWGFERLQLRGTVYPAAFLPGSRHLVLATEAGEVQIRDLDGRLVREVRRPRPPPIDALDVSPDGSILVWGDVDGEVWRYDLEGGEESTLLGRHDGRIKAVAFSPDGRRVATAADDGVLGLWDAASGERTENVAILGVPILALGFSPDGRTLAAGSHDGTVRLYRTHRTLWGRVLDGRGGGG